MQHADDNDVDSSKLSTQKAMKKIQEDQTEDKCLEMDNSAEDEIKKTSPDSESSKSNDSNDRRSLKTDSTDDNDDENDNEFNSGTKQHKSRSFRERKIKLVDITTVIEECASSHLSHDDPFVSSDSFSLLDSMAALELMNPIMDCCEGIDLPFSDQPMHSKQSNLPSPGLDNFGGRYPSQKDENKSSCLPWDDLTLVEVRDIALEAFIRLEAYLDAASIAESIYTCLYLHDEVLSDMLDRLRLYLPNDFHKHKNRVDSSQNNNDKIQEKAQTFPQKDVNLSQLSLAAISLSLVKLTETIRTIIQSADIYEEEDFTPTSYSFMFFHGYTDSDAIFLVDHCLTLLKEHIHKSVESEEHSVVLSLSKMMGFIRNFLESNSLLAKMSSLTVIKTVQVAKSMILEASKCLQELSQMKFFQEWTESSSSSFSKHPLSTKEKAFDIYINRHLLGNAPVRKINFKSATIAIHNLIGILDQLSMKFCSLFLECKSLHQVKHALKQVSRDNLSGNMHILTRSLIVLDLYFDDLLLGKFNLSKFIAQSMNQSCGIPLEYFGMSLTSTTSSSSADPIMALKDISSPSPSSSYGLSFLNRLGKPIYDILKLSLINPNRQRQYMIDNLQILHEWSGLQQEANKLDYYYKQNSSHHHSSSTKFSESASSDQPPSYMTNYTLSYTLQVMEEYISLGMELKLLNNGSDYSVAYWYWDFILSTRLNILSSMRNMKAKAIQFSQQHQKQQQQQVSNSTTKGGKRRGRGGKKNSHNKAQQVVQEQIICVDVSDDRNIGIEFLVTVLKRSLSRGIVRFIAALKQADFLDSPRYQFTSHRKRFQKRYGVFECLHPQPPCLTYDDYLQGSDFANVTPEELISSTSECFKAAKTVVDKLLIELQRKSSNETENDFFLPVKKEDLMKFAKVCVTNSLSVHNLSQLVAQKRDGKDSILKGDQEKPKVSFDFSIHKQFCSIRIG